MSNQNTNQHAQTDIDSNDPRIRFAAGVFAEIRKALLHNPAETPIHRIRISVHLEAGDDEVHCSWRRSWRSAVALRQLDR